MQPDYEGGNRDNLFIDHIYFRIEDPTAGGYKQFVGRNVWVQSDATYTDMLDEIPAEIIQHVPEFDLPTRQSVSDTEQKQPKEEKSKKKAVNLQQQTGGLFDELFDNENNKDNGLQRNDEVRSERLSANGNRNTARGSSRANSEEVRQESGRTQRRGESGSNEISGKVQKRNERPTGRLQGITEPKNSHNNHSERGKDHYNVKGIIDMSGGLYAKQGTTFPTRMILIEGRRSDEERAQTAVYPPVESKAIRKAESFDDLYDIINEVLNSKEKTNGTEVLRSRERGHVPVSDNSSGNTDGVGHNRQSRKNDDVGSRRKPTKEHSGGSYTILLREHRTNNADGEKGRQSDTIGQSANDGRGLGQRAVGNGNQSMDGVEIQRSGVGLKEEPKKRDLSEEKLPYRPHNTAFRLESVAPAAMVEAMDNVLNQIEAQHGSIDEFIRTELGYDTVEEAHQALAAEQMDSVAMAIYQMKQGQALIIGDQTGVGKGRQMAALI